MEIYFLLLIAKLQLHIGTSALHASPGKVGKQSMAVEGTEGNFEKIVLARVCTSHVSLKRQILDMPVCACEMRRFRKNGTSTEILNFQFHCPAKSFLLKDFVLLFCEVFFVNLYYASLR